MLRLNKMVFRVSIKKSDGQTEERTIDAPSRFTVYETVQKEGGTVLVLEERRGFKWPAWLDISIGSPVKRSMVIRFAKNVAVMLSAGLSLSRALSIVERQAPNKRAKTFILGIEEAIRKGSTFHDAIAAYPKVFSGLFIAMVRAGEESGTLGESLSTIALQLERSEELTKKVRGAMIYPSIVLIAIVIVAVLMLIFVVPTLTATFVSLGVQVPLSTRIIVAISNFMVANVALVVLALLALVAGIMWFVRSEPGRNMLTLGALRLPVIGELVRETYAARVSRTLASLLTAGVPVLQALAIARKTVRTNAFAAVIDEAQANVRKGEPLSVAFVEHSQYYPIQMGDMIAVGEETGRVSDMLREIAGIYEADVAEKTKDLSTIIEPVLMLVIGVFVGIFAVSMIAPIYSLSSAIH